MFEDKSLTLRVQESLPNMIGRNIVSLDLKSKNALGLTSGDIVEVEGKKKSAAIIWPAPPEDEGKEVIRMDSLIRRNVKVSLGDKVKVRKSDYREARKVMLAPTQEVRIVATGYDRILKRDFLGKPLTKGDEVLISVFGAAFTYIVTKTDPKGITKVTDATQFILKEEPVKGEIDKLPRIAYEDIGGLNEKVIKIRELIELPMRHPELFQKLGIDPPKGVLFYGPPGTGKTLLAKAVANETQANFILVNGPQIISKFVGEAEERIRQIFKEAEEHSPSIIFIDEIDAIAPKRDEVFGEVEKRVVAQLLASMDGLEARGDVIVIAATNRVNSLDEALRRPGRFDREIEIGVPDSNDRLEILQIHTRGMPLNKDVDLKHFAGITHGFVGADLAALTKEAAMRALRRYLPKMDLDKDIIPPEVLEALEVQRQDFNDGLKDVQPSALRAVLVEIPNIKWLDIGGLENVKEELKEVVEWPLKNAEVFKQMGVKPPKGILLYGPPGTGKTLLAKAVANESEANFISIKGPELMSMFVGESEKNLRKVFAKARKVAPVIVFFDEIDSIASQRGSAFDSGAGERMLDQLLTELSGVEELKNVVFIAATNRPDLVDPALLRPGRIDKIILVPSPDEKSREEILKVHLTNVPLEKDFNVNSLAIKTDGFSGADLEGLIKEAVLIALRENNLKPTMLNEFHFEKALRKVFPSVTTETILAYNAFREQATTQIKPVKPSYVK
ncbi:MAG: CDC48 family AAA ATPase [archaeon]